MLLLASFRISDQAPKTTAVRCGSYLHIENPTHGVDEPYIKKVTITRLIDHTVEVYNIPSGSTSLLLPAILHPGNQYKIDYQLMPSLATPNHGLLTMKYGSGTMLASAEYLEGAGGIPTVSITTYVDCYTYYVRCHNY